MSDEQQQQEAPLTDEELRMTIDGRSTDWFLQKFVSLANTIGLSCGITLFVEGAMISGMLVSGKRYFEAFADEFSSNYPGDDEAKEEVRAGIASHTAIYADDESDDESDNEPPPPQYIHLVDARYFAPGGQPIPTNRGVLWRGRINAVSGFNLGTLMAE